MFGAVLDHPAGLGMAVMRRAQALATVGISTEILVDTFYPDYDGHTARLADSGSLGDLIKVRSLHQELAGHELYPVDVAYSSPLVEGFTYVPDKDKDRASRAYEGEEYMHYVWTRAGKVNFMDHMRDGKRVRRDWHDEAGAVCKVELMNAANKTELARYLRRDGSCYMEEIMDAATGKVRRESSTPCTATTWRNRASTAVASIRTCVTSLSICRRSTTSSC